RTPLPSSPCPSPTVLHPLPLSHAVYALSFYRPAHHRDPPSFPTRRSSDLGFPAVATTSAGVAWALGYPDGERISRDEMLAVVHRIAAAVRVPVTADLEAGYGATPEAAARTARDAIAAGAVGLNIEDGTNEGRLLDASLHVERIQAVREAGAAAGVAIVVNARTDAFEIEQWTPAQRLAEAVRRANAYRAAGADCLIVVHVSGAGTT